MFSPKISGIRYKINNTSDVIQQTLMSGRQWNAEIIQIIYSYIQQRKLTHFLNVGSHIGSVCLPLSLHIRKVTAIEAYPETYHHLRDNIVLNKLSNVYALNVAVGNSEEDIYFMSKDKVCPIENINRIANNSGGMHVFTQRDIANNIRSANLTDKKIKHKMNKLDNLVTVDNFDIMLVDIEGFEYVFLLGAKQKILKNKPIIIIEIWSNDKRTRENMKETQEDVVQYFQSLGYRMVAKIGKDFIFDNVKN